MNGWIHPDLVPESAAARVLGLKASTLRRRIERVGLRPDAASPTRRFWDVRALEQALDAAPSPSEATREALTAELGAVDRDDGRPLAAQIADDLRAAVVRGAFGTRRRLPATGAIARHYGVSDNTVRRAVRVLRAEGLVVRRGDTGT